MKIVKCPVCGLCLEKDNKSYICKNNHTFDIAKEGYVNLMLSNQKNSKNPGDNKLMMSARQNFLNAGYYNQLLNEIINVLKGIVANGSVVVEAGCGEGFYISAIKDAFNSAYVYGFDISKEAIKMASKRNKNVNFYVASSYNTYIKDGSVDALVVIFAPFAEEEFNRILSNYGSIILVKPKTEHLLEIKNQFYENIKNVEQNEYKNFIVHKTISVSYRIYPTQQDLQNLLKMTPFFYQVGEKKQKIDNFDAKNGIKLDFFVEVLKKIKI